jgi:hypothetical protein
MIGRMDVFLVETGAYEEREVAGVFSGEAKAREFIRALGRGRFWPTTWHLTRWGTDLGHRQAVDWGEASGYERPPVKIAARPPS